MSPILSSRVFYPVCIGPIQTDTSDLGVQITLCVIPPKIKQGQVRIAGRLMQRESPLMQSLSVNTCIIDLEPAHIPFYKIGWPLLLKVPKGHGVVPAEVSGDENLGSVQPVDAVETFFDLS
uniref:Uncharacterized protein n=1 Tax=Cacopsylla melanoneura TaxID=428564 RepID=A0A8D8XCE5_9HEMI